MLGFFRNIFKSKLGLLVTFALLALIALAFATADVANVGTFGGVGGGDRVAVVGDTKIASSELTRAAGQALDRARQQEPTLSMPAFIARGGLDQVLEDIVNRAAIAEYAREHGFRAGDNLINSEIQTIGAFRGPDGNFSADVYAAAIASQGLSDRMVRDDLGNGLLAQLMLQPASIGVRYPGAAASRYAMLFKERRVGGVGFLPSAAYAPAGPPDAAALQRFYTREQSRFIRPERRQIRYALFGPDAVSDKIQPSPAQIAARYQRDATQYGARETRAFTQLIAPTEAAARAIAQRVAAGATLSAAAAGTGLQPAQVAATDRAAFAAQSSPAVAAAYFAAAEGRITSPARGALGWYVARVDSVTRTAGQSLAQATPAITAALLSENRAKALADLSAGVEQQLAEGATLPEVAQTLRVMPQTTGQLVATGQGYEGAPPAPEMLLPALATAFQMDEATPQVTQVPGSDQFLVFEVTGITPSAPAPLAEIQNDVAAAWRLSQGAIGARAAADRVLARLKAGMPLAAALAGENRGLPAPDAINLSREELAARRERVAPPLALFFSMAQGTAKPLEAPRDSGWFVVDLDRIELGTLAASNPLVQQARTELATAFSAELTQQAVAAMRREVGVEINRASVAAVRKQLLGTN